MRSAYRGLVSDAYLAGLSPARRADRWRAFLADPQAGRVLVVADDDVDGVIGFAAAGPERSGDPTYRGEVYEIGGAMLTDVAYGWTDLETLLRALPR